ncbi:MAG: hypothetical protein WCM76_16840, partial [Bacteroidota bacterium]
TFTFNNVTFAGHATISGTNNYNILSFSSGKTYTLPANLTQTIYTDFIANGACGNNVSIQSSSNGTKATISKSTGTINVDYVTLKDNQASGGATYNATNTTVISNVSGWNVTSPGNLSVDYYWIGGSGNWSQPSHWSLSSGGTPNSAGCIPGSSNSVFFDANSGFTSTSKTVTVDVSTASCKDMSWSGALSAPVFTTTSSSNNLMIYGSLTLIPAMNYSFNGQVYFESTTTGKTITSANKQFQNAVYFDGAGGEWTLQDDFKCSSTLQMNYGSLITNNVTLNINGFSSANYNTRSLNMGSSLFIIFSGDFYGYYDNFTIIPGTSTLRFTSSNGFTTYSSNANKTFYNLEFTSPTATNYITNSSGRTFTFNNVTFAGHATISGTNNYNSLTLSPGKTYTLPSNLTQTISGNLNATGLTGQVIDIRSSSAGTQATISKASGCVVGDYLQLKDSKATGGAAFYAGLNSINVSNNTGWTFSVPTPLPGGGTITGADTVCNGSSGIVFSVSPISGATTYTWTVPAGASITAGQGTTSITVTFGPTSGQVTVFGIAGNCAYSPTISHTVIVAGGVSSSVTVYATPSGPICPGTSVTFNAFPVNGGTTPAYQWKLNGNNTGTNSSTYTNAGLANGDAIYCLMSSNLSCANPATATSNTITMSVTSGITPIVSISASPSNSICAGTSVTFTASPTNGGTPVYQWQLNGSNVGNNTNTYVNGSLANNDFITCVMTSNASCASPVTATSNTITMIVNPVLTPTVSIAASPSGAICAGTSVTFTASPTNGGTPVYQWKLNGSNVGNNTNTYVNGSLANNDFITCVMTSNATCASPVTAT